ASASPSSRFLVSAENLSRGQGIVWRRSGIPGTTLVADHVSVFRPGDHEQSGLSRTGSMLNCPPLWAS
ncbi:MAG: hypothetical protein WEB59_02145, partial [Thermoanaerobaculia bacterium]